MVVSTSNLHRATSASSSRNPKSISMWWRNKYYSPSTMRGHENIYYDGSSGVASDVEGWPMLEEESIKVCWISCNASTTFLPLTLLVHKHLLRHFWVISKDMEGSRVGRWGVWGWCTFIYLFFLDKEDHSQLPKQELRACVSYNPRPHKYICIYIPKIVLSKLCIEITQALHELGLIITPTRLLIFSHVWCLVIEKNLTRFTILLSLSPLWEVSPTIDSSLACEYYFLQCNVKKWQKSWSDFMHI